jgi:alkylation response protein AidB-like acyl-CoA dehydrogenase
MIALVRSSGEASDRQKGLSQFIVDLSLPGVVVKPIRELTGDAHFSEVSFNDALLSEDALIGNEGAGWEQVTAELAFERSGPERLYSSIVLLDHWIACLRRSGGAAAHAAVIGRFAAHLATLRGMSIAVTTRLAQGESPIVEAALVKDIGTEFEQSIPSIIGSLVAASPGAEVDADLYRTAAYLSQVAPTFSLRGGTREILRGMIARGLGLR